MNPKIIVESLYHEISLSLIVMNFKSALFIFEIWNDDFISH